MIRSIIAISILINTCCLAADADAQSSSDFVKDPSHKIALDAGVEKRMEGLPFRWPQVMPKLLKFQIGEYKTVNPTGRLVDDRVDTQDAGVVDVGNAVINSILNKRHVSDYRSRKGTNMGSQRYTVSLLMEGYGNTITVNGDVIRFFNAKFSSSGMEGSVETSSNVLNDTTFLAGIIGLPNDSTWNVDVAFKQSETGRNVSGAIYSKARRYMVSAQTKDHNGKYMDKVALVVQLDDTVVAAIEFPKMHGSKGNVLFDSKMLMSDRQAIIGFSALFFAYREILTNL